MEIFQTLFSAQDINSLRVIFVNFKADMPPRSLPRSSRISLVSQTLPLGEGAQPLGEGQSESWATCSPIALGAGLDVPLDLVELRITPSPTMRSAPHPSRSSYFLDFSFKDRSAGKVRDRPHPTTR
jgi:hypothetical protein